MNENSTYSVMLVTDGTFILELNKSSTFRDAVLSMADSFCAATGHRWCHRIFAPIDDWAMEKTTTITAIPITREQANTISGPDTWDFLDEEGKMTAKTYRKLPVEIQAFYWDGTDSDEMLDAITDFVGETMWHLDSSKIYISTLEGLMSSKAPCYIIRGVQGEYYICDPDIFNATYEEVN